MQVVSKVIRLDLNYASEVSHLYQKRTCYIAPYKTELAEHFARRLLAYLSLFEFSPQLSKTEGAGKTPDLYVSDATDHIKLWCNVDLLSEKHMQRASHQADQVVLFLDETDQKKLKANTNNISAMYCSIPYLINNYWIFAACLKVICS